ncbi:vicilin-like seed storage protein At2g18540, partial [Vigna umbellata]|uniref:vicilin-like seed storage protein At2g18540 n=1 Tax=Vigna umbellata TaxID=87088 RepID=UPI001F5FABF8
CNHSFPPKSLIMLTMEPQRKALALSWILIFFLSISLCGVKASSEGHHGEPQEGPVVTKDQRRTLLATEFGQITALDIKEEPDKLPYHLQFITLEPNSLFLPVLLHSDMVFYVHTGSGKLTWAHDDDTGTIPLREGDVSNLNEGSVFYIQSDLEAERRKLRIYAMLTNTEDNTYNPSIGAYSRIDQLVKGFDKKIMQAALKVPDDLIEEIINKKNTPAIVHADSKKTNIVQTLEASFLRKIVGVGSNALEKYNILDHEPDFKNRYGRSVAISKTQLKSLKRTNIGFLMVHLNEGSIMEPHWNPKAAELAVAVEGKGMVRVVNGSSNEGDTERQSMRFKVNAGDAFVVPRFHSMAQMAFNDEPFVFLGFSTSAKDNRPQFLTGKGSVLHNLDKHILATSLGVSDRTVDELRRSPRDSIIFACSTCAEEEESTMKEEEREIKREEEEERKREEEEDRKRERKREREEVEAKKQQEEREKKREEEEEREQEEGGREKKREREEVREREEEAAKRQQEKREKKREKEKGEEAEEAKKEQEKREMKRQEEDQSEGKEEEDPTWWERPRREKGKGSGEEVAEQEQEQAKRQQEEREKKREHESDPDHFEGRRALKVRNL